MRMIFCVLLAMPCGAYTQTSNPFQNRYMPGVEPKQNNSEHVAIADALRERNAILRREQILREVPPVEHYKVDAYGRVQPDIVKNGMDSTHRAILENMYKQRDRR